MLLDEEFAESVRHVAWSIEGQERASPPPYVPVVVLHWGNPDTTVRCLPSLRKASGPGRRSVLVIDDTERLDGAAAAEIGPLLEIEVHRPGHNLGLSDGCTLGLSHNDAIVDPGFLDHLVRTSMLPSSD